MRRLAVAAGTLIGLYLILRAIAEPFVIDVGDPSTYEDDWGGPSLAGVLLVHCGPGIVAAAVPAPVAAGARRSRRLDRGVNA